MNQKGGHQDRSWKDIFAIAIAMFLSLWVLITIIVLSYSDNNTLRHSFLLEEHQNNFGIPITIPVSSQLYS